MSRHCVGRSGGLLIGVACLLGLATACSTDTPVAPVQTPAPIVGLVAQFICVASGDVVQFFDQSLGRPTSYSWQFGDGGKSTKRDPVHTYKDPFLTDYRVRLEIRKEGEAPASAETFLSLLGCLPAGSSGGDDEGDGNGGGGGGGG